MPNSAGVPYTLLLRIEAIWATVIDSDRVNFKFFGLMLGFRV